MEYLSLILVCVYLIGFIVMLIALADDALPSYADEQMVQIFVASLWPALMLLTTITAIKQWLRERDKDGTNK